MTPYAKNHSRREAVTAGASWARWLPEGLPPVVWDPSAGFGARMLGFLSLFPEGTYIANEPARQTFAEATTLARLLCGEDAERRVVLIPRGSEIEGPAQPVSMVFTSPPYFDKERYFDEPGQCWRDYPSEAEWKKRYLYPTVHRAADALRPGGHLVLNVDELRRDAVLAAAKEAGLTFMDEQVLQSAPDHFLRAQGKQGATEPILVFRKDTSRCVVSIPETNGSYSVSDDGTVLSYAQNSQGKVLKGATTPLGYRAVGIYAEGGERPQTHLVHRLVCRAFHGPPPSVAHTHVRHLDGDKTNNCASNLAWTTRRENVHAAVWGHAEGAPGTTPTSAEGEGEESGCGRRTRDAALVQVCVDLLNEGRLQLVDVARLLACSKSMAFNLMRGRNGTHVLTAQRPGKKQRSVVRKEQIYSLIEEGRTRAEINTLLDETLSAQDFYYYNQTYMTRTRARKA